MKLLNEYGQIMGPNGEELKEGDDGRLVDMRGRYGYHAHFTGAYICYTCGVLCECGEE